MKTLYTANTPNGQKITIALQELGLKHDVIFVNLNDGEQHRPPLSDLNPNHKIPVLVESDGTAFFESGAILMHLYGETRSEVLQWLFLQVASVGPMLGQLWFFRHAAAAPNIAALERYAREANRLYGVYEARLSDQPWLACGEYSIADIATFTWLRTHEELGIQLESYPAVAAWLARIEARPAVKRGLAAAVAPPAESTKS